MSGRKSHHGLGERAGGRVGKVLAPGDPPLLMRRPDGRGVQFAPGHKKVGGTKKGYVNPVTAEVRRLVGEFVTHGLGTAKRDYDKLRRRKGGDARALAVLIGAAEYILPKLARTETVGEGGGPVRFSIITLSGEPKPPPQNAVVEPEEEK